MAHEHKPVDITAPSVEEAIDQGLAQLGLQRNEVIIEIVEEGSRGILGMGSRDAIVRLIPLRAPRPAAPPAVTPTPAPAAPGAEAKARREESPRGAQPQQDRPDRPRSDRPREERPRQDRPARPERRDEPRPARPPRPAADHVDDDEYPMMEGGTEEEAEIAREVLTELLAKMEVEASIRVYRSQLAPGDEDPVAPWVLDIEGEDLGALIGRRGETLSSLQYIARMIASRRLEQRTSFIVDVQGYRSRREETLRTLALRMAQRARQQGRTMTLEPMPPNERRIIHLTLRDDNTVITESVGDGEHRKVTIRPVRSNIRN